jgi:WD40 repeat protein
MKAIPASAVLFRTLVAAAAIVLGQLPAPRPAHAADETIPIAQLERDTPVDFEREILPLLKRSCLACHNRTKAESGLVLETPQTILQGGDSGPAVIANNSAESLLLRRASGVDGIMPPKDNKAAARPLTSEELGLIKLWIDQGATGTVSGTEVLNWQPLPPGVNPIYAVAVSPDGQFAACGRANQIFIYHLPTQRMVCRLTDPELLSQGVYQQPGVADLDLIQSLAFSPDGMTLASGGFQTVKLWRRPRDVRELSIETGITEGPVEVATSPDGRWLAAATQDNAIRLIDLAAGQQAALLSGHAGRVTALRFSPDGTRLWSAALDHTVRAWSVPDGAITARIDTPAPLAALTLVNGGQLLATAGDEPIIRLWNAPTALPAQPALPRPATSLAASPERNLAACGSADGSLHLLDLAAGQVAQTLSGPSAALLCVTWQIGGARLAAGAADGSAWIWDAATYQPVAALAAGPQEVTAVALHPSGNQAATATSDGQLLLWKLDVPAPRPLLAAADEAAATVMTVSRDGRLAATAGTAGGQPAILVRELATGNTVATLLGHTAAITSLSFSPDGSRLASGGQDNTVRVWNMADGQPISQFGAHAAPVTTVVFSGSGQEVVSGAADGSLHLWNAADGAALRPFSGHGGAIVAVAYAAAGQRVISSSADGTLRFWNAADGQQLASVTPPAPPTAMALARDESRLALACADQTIVLYQTADGQVLATLPAGGAVRSLDFNADHTRLAAVTGEDRVVVWEPGRQAVQETLRVPAGVAAAAFTAQPGELLVASQDKLITLQALHHERALPSLGQKVVGLAYAADGSLIYAAAADGTLRAYQIADGQQRFNTSHGAAVHALAQSPDGRFLATAGENGQIRVWNADGSPAAKGELGGFSAPVVRVAFSADNVYVAGGTAAGEVRIYHVADGAVVQTFAEHAAGITGMAARGQAGFVSASADGAVRLWYVWAVRQLAGHGGPVVALETHPAAATQIISGSQDGTVRLWNTADGAVLQQLNHGAPVAGVAVRPDGQRLASVGGNLVRLWNAQNYQQVAELKGEMRSQLRVSERERALAAARSRAAAEGQLVAAAEQLAAAEAENLKRAMEAAATAQKALDEKTAAAKAAEEPKLAAEKAVADARAAAKAAEEALAAAVKAVADAEVAKKAADEAVAQAKTELDNDAGNAEKAKALEEAQKVATDAATALASAQEAKTNAEKAVADTAAALKAAMDDLPAKVKAFDDAEAARKSAEITKQAADKAVQSAMTLAQKAADAVPAAKEVLAAAEARVKEAEAQLAAAREAAAAAEQPLHAVAFSAEGGLLAAGGEDRLVRLWSSETGAAVDTITGHNAPVHGLAFAGLRLATAAPDGAAIVWNTSPEWTWIRTLSPSTGVMLVDRVTALDFSPDGSLLAAGSGDPSRSGQLVILNPADGTVVRELPDAHSDTVLGVEFSPDGVYLASCGADKFVKVFETATGSFVKAFEGHTHHVLGVSWRADGKVLASCGADNAVKVWDFTSGEQRTTIGGFGKEVTSIQFIAEGSLILTSCGDRLVRRHNVDNGQNTVNYGGGADFMYAAATTPDGKIHVAGGQDSVLRVWNGDNGQALFNFEPPPQTPPPAQAAR